MTGSGVIRQFGRRERRITLSANPPYALRVFRASVKPMKMMDRPIAVPDVEAIGAANRRADQGPGITTRGFHVAALRKPCAYGGRRDDPGPGGVFTRVAR